MTALIDYSGASYPIREDFTASHDYCWNRLAAPGTWLTGTQRVAVAKEVRQAQRCSLCRLRKEALSPYGVDGAHETVTDLSDVMVEVVHWITTEPQRLTKAWFDGIMQRGLTEEEYVEILGTLGAVFQIDEFCRGIGAPLHGLPEPQPGEPSHYRPANAVRDVGRTLCAMSPGCPCCLGMVLSEPNRTCGRATPAMWSAR